MRKLLIIDSHCLGHIAKHSMAGLKYGNIETGVIFGFLRQVQYLMKNFENYTPVFCWDSKKSFRKEVYKGYKNKGCVNKTEEELYLDTTSHAQFGTLRTEVLPLMGFQNIFIKTGYEADDLIASIVIEQNNPENIVVANDEDLFQLLKVCKIYNPRTKMIVTEKLFQDTYKITVDKWPTIKSIAGCSSDNVGGVAGVGEKTAIKYLLKELPLTAKAYKDINNNSDLIETNLAIVELPLEGTGTFKLAEQENIYSKEAFIRICNIFGFASFLKPDSYKDWEKVLKFNA